MPMRILLNGEAKELEDGISVARLLTELSVHDERVAVEVNLDVIRRAERTERILKEGDRVEVVSFVGGGA